MNDAIVQLGTDEADESNAQVNLSVAHATRDDITVASNPGVYCRGERDLILVDGADAITYLQGQLSADIVALALGASARSLLLSPQGKLVAWLRCTRLATNIVLLDVSCGLGNATCERLNRFKLRVDVKLELREGVACLFIRGVKSSANLAQDLGVVGVGSTYVVDAGWAATPGIDVFGTEDELLDRYVKQSGAIEVSAEVFDALRVALLREPMWLRELTDGMIPAEADLVESSISFTKGCYTGQELTARLDSRGSRTARTLVTATAAISGQLKTVQSRTLWFTDDTGAIRDAGAITSAAQIDNQLFCFAYVKRSVLSPQSVSDDLPDNEMSDGNVVGEVPVADLVLTLKSSLGDIVLKVVRT